MRLFAALFLGGTICANCPVLLAEEGLAKKSSKVDAGSLQGCAFYRAKQGNTPVYAEAETSSRVIARLKGRELVCHIGERGEFVIIDWRKQELINKGKSPQVPMPEMAFVRKLDLYAEIKPPGADSPAAAGRGWFEEASEQLQLLLHGVKPDDIYGPLRPILEPFHPSLECRAGEEICEKVEQEMQRIDAEGQEEKSE